MANFSQSFISWKKLTFKGQERSCNFLFQNFWELRLMQNQFLSKKNHFWFIQNLNLVEFEGVYCTVAYPCWPLKAKKFSSKHFFLRKWSMVKIWLISIHWFLRYRGGSKSQTRQGADPKMPWKSNLFIQEFSNYRVFMGNCIGASRHSVASWLKCGFSCEYKCKYSFAALQPNSVR